jgi:hypothetical protein
MDILNWIYIKTQGLIRTTPSNADTDLVAIGGQVPFTTRDDGYQTYGMTIKDLSVAGDVANTGYYTLDYSLGFTVNVTTQKGVIEITNFDSDMPLPAFAQASPLVIQNTDITFGNPDNIYVQLTPYYRPVPFDTFIPYILATGAILGQEVAIFDANPAVAGVNRGEGVFYVYYELYQF